MSAYLNINKLPCIVVLCLILFACRKEKASWTGSPLTPPIANAGADQIIVKLADSTTVSSILDGHLSSDSFRNIVSYRWMQVAGPTTSKIADSSAVKTTVTNLIVGVYEFELKVTNSYGLYSKDTMKITIQLPPSEVICVYDRPQINAQLVPVGTLSKAKSGFSVAYAGNKILFAGGVDSVNVGYSKESSSVDIYDLETQSWSTANLKTARTASAVAVNGNKIFFAGGGYIDDSYFSTIDIYDASSNTWTATDLSIAKIAVAAASVGNKVMFAGGNESDLDDDIVDNRVEIYNLSTASWSFANLSEARTGIRAVTINQKIYFLGGYSNGQVSNRIDIYDDSTKSWSVSQLSFLPAVWSAIAGGDKIFITNSDCEVEIRNTSTGTSTLETLSRSAPFGLTSVLKDNKIVFLRERSKTFDIYDLPTGQWSVGVLPQPLFSGASIISANNTIYVAGGMIDCKPIGNGGCSPVYSNLVWKLEF
jgi:hypothetical protein